MRNRRSVADGSRRSLRPLDSDFKPAGGLIGAGLDECRWPRPVRPGDELRIECEVLDVRPSKSRPEQGLIKLRTTTLNQDGEAVLVHVVNLVVPRRKDGASRTVDRGP
jgi:acyl dehydratase